MKLAYDKRKVFNVVVTNLWVFSSGKDMSKDSFIQDDKLSSPGFLEYCNSVSQLLRFVRARPQHRELRGVRFTNSVWVL